jgi:hypothetical protein
MVSFRGGEEVPLKAAIWVWKWRTARWPAWMAGLAFALVAVACTAAPTPATDATASITAPAPDSTARPAPTSTALPSPTPTPTSEPTPAVLIAVGDIAGCEAYGDEETAALVDAMPGTVAVLGDTVYPGGAPEEYAECYEPSWGRLRERTRPAVGNHEYLTPGAAGYFGYFGPSAGPSGLGYYSYDLGAWHVVVVNSQCWEVGGCGRGDPQARWLEEDLLAHPADCTLAYWHVPRFSSGIHGGSDLMQTYWELLHQAGAEIVLNGHDHDYERFAPQDPQGNTDPERGIREFVVGTGGFGNYFFLGALPNSEVRDASTYGVLVLRLFPGRYEWEFVPVPGGTFTDNGSGVCHP